MWEQIRANQRRTILLASVMAVLMILIGMWIGEYFAGDYLIGIAGAAALWLVLLGITYAGGDSIFLGMSGARKIASADHPVLYNVVEEMKIASGLTRLPDIYIIDDPGMNAFATGRNPNSASIAVTSGLLEQLNRDELQGVIAHEMAHIQNRDVLYMLFVGVMMGAIVLLADLSRRVLFWGGGRSRRRTSSGGGGQIQAILLIVGLILMILSPLFAQLIYFACSRRKEYLADACAARYTRYPEGLAGALEKIVSRPIPMTSAIPSLASMYIIHPQKKGERGMADLTSTHPPVSERIRILRTMGGGASFKDYDQAFRQVTKRPVGVLPFSAVKKQESVPLRHVSAEVQSPLERVRSATDALWRLNQFIFISCVCGTKMKVPLVYSGKRIQCPHCGTEHIAAQTNPV